MERQISPSINSDVAKVAPDVAALFDNHNFTYVSNWKLDTLPLQRCSDDKYIPDGLLVDYYRNLDYRMLDHIDYPSKVIEGMSKFSFWLVTSISEKGMQSPMNMYMNKHYANIHPGKKRYIVANYLGLDSVPVLVQQPKTEPRVDGVHIENVDQIIDLYGNNVSIKVARNYNEEALECSWHGETNLRDDNDYDNWWSVASTSIDHDNQILRYLRIRGKLAIVSYNNSHRTGLTVVHGEGSFATIHHSDQYSGGSFYIETDLKDIDYWQLYFHFDPRVGRKTDKKLGISIVNHFGDPNWVMDVDFSGTLNRPWLPDPEKI